MTSSERSRPVIFVLFGIGGNLAERKLVPALYTLSQNGLMPERWAILGLGRSGMPAEGLRARLRQGIVENSRRGVAVDDERWRAFSSRLTYLQTDASNPATIEELAEQLARIEHDWDDAAADRIFYLSIPPRSFAATARNLAAAGLQKPRQHSRIVVEKPFGHDLDSARRLNRSLTEIFDESQIYRIDHYLGKETVQNIMVFRFGNSLFEPIWNSQYIDHVQITVAEPEGVGQRGGYYDSAGALRDMVQNHLLQVFSLSAMEPPRSLGAREVRERKLDVLGALRPIHQERVHDIAVRGQYGSGWVQGERVRAYREEPDVAADSSTESFAAVKLHVDNWRWRGVPFYLRTGKRLPGKASEVMIQFRSVPHHIFPSVGSGNALPNRLLLSIQPHEGIFLRFEVKHPGPSMRLAPVLMQFDYQDAFGASPPDAYETLLLDVMQGDATLFMDAEQTEAAWAVLRPVLGSWSETKPYSFPNYSAGSWGPEESHVLLAQDGRSWSTPTVLKCQDDVVGCRIAAETT